MRPGDSELELPAALWQSASSRRFSLPSAMYRKIKHQVHASLAAVHNCFFLIHNLCVAEFKGDALFDEGVGKSLPDTFKAPYSALPHTFEIASAGIKGLGMFARRPIPAGGLILVEHPVIVSPSLFGLTIPISTLYLILLDRLPLATFRQVMNLANCSSPWKCSPLEGIMRTNAINIEIDVHDSPHPERSKHHAIFLKASRCNHSCSPNAKIEWDTASFSLSIEAVRPIPPGEEITFQYIPITAPRDERQVRLHALYGFTCHCPGCSLPTIAAILISDHARISLRNTHIVHPTFEEWCIDPRIPADALIRAHTRVLRLMAQEGLEVLGGARHVEAIAMCYGALGDVDMFRMWARWARDARAARSPKQAAVLTKWINDPRTFPVWGWRVEFCATRSMEKSL